MPCATAGAQNPPNHKPASPTQSLPTRCLLPAACCVLATILPAASQTLRVAPREDPDILDPTLARFYVGRIVLAGLCAKLFDLDESLHIVPQLATA